MDADALRRWGMIASGGALVMALAIALLGGEGKHAARAIVRVPPAMAAPAVRPIDEPLTFTVRFGAEHPLAQAQALAAHGRSDDAAHEVETILPQRSDLAGLCLVRFINAGDLVLKPCAPLAPAARERARRRWSARFAAMRDISYAQADMILVKPAEAGERGQ
ncbi:MAG: hypothetical protein ABUS57_16255 [Pseudomonadota bacterium]